MDSKPWLEYETHLLYKFNIFNISFRLLSGYAFGTNFTTLIKCIKLKQNTTEIFLPSVDEQLIDKSSLWEQSCLPQPKWLHSAIFVSDPLHRTLSIHIWPDPCPYMAQQYTLDDSLHTFRIKQSLYESCMDVDFKMQHKSLLKLNLRNFLKHVWDSQYCDVLFFKLTIILTVI